MTWFLTIFQKKNVIFFLAINLAQKKRFLIFFGKKSWDILLILGKGDNNIIPGEMRTVVKERFCRFLNFLVLIGFVFLEFLIFINFPSTFPILSAKIIEMKVNWSKSVNKYFLLLECSEIMCVCVYMCEFDSNVESKFKNLFLFYLLDYLRNFVLYTQSRHDCIWSHFVRSKFPILSQSLVATPVEYGEWKPNKFTPTLCITLDLVENLANFCEIYIFHKKIFVLQNISFDVSLVIFRKWCYVLLCSGCHPHL